jgi:hypothetical protein
MESFAEPLEVLVFGVDLGLVLGKDESIFVDFWVQTLHCLHVLNVLLGLLDSVFDLVLLEFGETE